jgi:hypothetical protein
VGAQVLVIHPYPEAGARRHLQATALNTKRFLDQLVVLGEVVPGRLLAVEVRHCQHHVRPRNDIERPPASCGETGTEYVFAKEAILRNSVMPPVHVTSGMT